MVLRYFITVFCLFYVFNGIFGEEEAVTALKDSTFEDYIASNSLVLAEFYAPWCGHCKNLAPEYEKAAKVLKESEPPVYFVKIDATEEKELASKYEVQGYPTLKFFRDGKVEDYDGPRDADGIVDHMKKITDPDYKPPPESVVTLESQEDFDEFIVSAELTLVEFYAPWCGHCKKLAPEYEKAAKRLLMESPPIKLAKMDATVHKEVSDKYDVKGFPTLLLFRAKPDADGVMKAKSFEYNGPREERGIISYMIKQAGEAAKPINSIKELKARFLIDDVIVVGMFSEKDNSAYELYQDTANSDRDKYQYYYTTSQEIRSKYKVSDKEVVVVFQPELMVTKYDRPFYAIDITDEVTAVGVASYLAEHDTPLIGTRTKANSQRYSQRPLCVLFVPVDWSHEYRQMTASWRDKLLPLANKYHKSMYFAMSDDEQNSDDVKSFGLDDSGSDFNIGCYGSANEKFPMEELDEWDEEEVEEFFKRVLEGKVKPFLKSQIPPKKQTTPVATVTGRTFKDIVFDETKDVLIELYAPWCGHCKKFAPEYVKLAKQLSSEKNLVIAKMDAVANDAPETYAAKGFPTIYFAPANQKDSPVKYDGNRDLEDMKKFMKENSQVSFQSNKDEL